MDTSLGGVRVVGVLERLAETRGLPEVITVDNGPEFAGKALDEWAYRRGVKLNFIRPGKPVENAFAESFNGRLRDEVFEYQLVHEHQTCQGGHRELATGLQSGQTPQLVERQVANGVC